MTPQPTARGILEGLARRGVAVKADGEIILFRPAALVTAEDREQINGMRPAILELLQTWDRTLEALCAALPAEAALALREERAAITEHQAHFSHTEAEHRAGLPDAHASPIEQTA